MNEQKIATLRMKVEEQRARNERFKKFKVSLSLSHTNTNSLACVCLKLQTLVAFAWRFEGLSKVKSKRWFRRIIWLPCLVVKWVITGGMFE